MPSLAYFLDRTKQLCESIRSLKFSPPGIFTNAFIKEPSITRLLKDAADHEQSLYKINRPKDFRSATSNYSPGLNGGEKEAFQYQPEVRPERIDGKSYFIDYSFSDYTNIQNNNNNINNNKSEQATQGRKRTAVRIPDIVKESSETGAEQSETPSSPERVLNVKLIPESVIKSNDIKEICECILNLIQKYPNLIEENFRGKEEGVLNDIVQFHQEYISLTKEVEELQDVVNEQKEQLQFYNVSFNDRSPVQRKRSADSSDESDQLIDLDELIRREEEEIKQLEENLSKRQKLAT